MQESPASVPASGFGSSFRLRASSKTRPASLRAGAFQAGRGRRLPAAWSTARPVRRVRERGPIRRPREDGPIRRTLVLPRARDSSKKVQNSAGKMQTALGWAAETVIQLARFHEYLSNILYSRNFVNKNAVIQLARFTNGCASTEIHCSRSSQLHTSTAGSE